MSVGDEIELLRQSEPEAAELALAIELFTEGSLSTFARQTNVDLSNCLICYDILDLSKQLQAIGMLVVLDSILNRITQNRARGKSTFIVIDEIYLLFQHEYSANFLFTLWKRAQIWRFLHRYHAEGDVDVGHGLLKNGSALVPFSNQFPRNTQLYRLMTTMPGETLDM